MFQQYLANSLSAPGSRRNYLCGARKWIQARGGNASALSSAESTCVYKGALVTRPHTPNPAPPLAPQDLVRVCQYLDCAAHTSPIKAALCLGFFAFLRASNLLSPTVTLWSGPHTLSRVDITSHPHGLTVVIHSSKTITASSPPAIVSLPRIPSSPACPATAWDLYVSQVPASPQSPAFILFNGRPLTPTILNEVVRDALVYLGCPYGPKFSGHSLRRGGSQAAVQAGSIRQDIAKHGTWSSIAGMKPYVPSSASTRVANNMATLFA